MLTITEDRGLNLDHVDFKQLEVRARAISFISFWRAYRRVLFRCQQLPINQIDFTIAAQIVELICGRRM